MIKENYKKRSNNTSCIKTLDDKNRWCLGCKGKRKCQAPQPAQNLTKPIYNCSKDVDKAFWCPSCQNLNHMRCKNTEYETAIIFFFLKRILLVWVLLLKGFALPEIFLILQCIGHDHSQTYASSMKIPIFWIHHMRILLLFRLNALSAGDRVIETSSKAVKALVDKFSFRNDRLSDKCSAENRVDYR
jgi:hypothetical protein